VVIRIGPFGRRDEVLGEQGLHMMLDEKGNKGIWFEMSKGVQ
jgi:hypothetical protein